MPIVSKNQGMAMNIAKAIQGGEVAPRPGTPSADIAKSMKPSDLADYSGPIPASLPKKLPKVKVVGKGVKKMRIK